MVKWVVPGGCLSSGKLLGSGPILPFAAAAGNLL